jgi:hypothetical protein
MVGVSLIALMGAAAVAVDLGNLWSSRRRIVVASDAAALAAAADHAVGRDGCEATAGDFVGRNDDSAAMTGCTATAVDATAGYVTVRAETPVDYAFAPVIGVADRTVGAATSAGWGIPSAARGLRPFGLCEDDPAFTAWAASPRGVSAVARVPYTNQPTDCGGAPGNWGIIDLDNTGSVSNADTKEWVVRGYPGSVRPGWVGGDPGAYSNSIDPELGSVRGSRFPIPVFDAVAAAGQNAKFRIVGFVNIELVGWRTTGPEQGRYLDVRFVEMVAAGECCDPGGRDFGLRVVHICEVDPGDGPSRCTS